MRVCVYVLFVSVCVCMCCLYACVHGFMFVGRIGKTLTRNCNLHVNNITTDQFPHNTSMVQWNLPNAVTYHRFI